MARTPKGMDREDIKAEIRKRGQTLSSLSTTLGYCDNAVSVALRMPWPELDVQIAKFLGKELHQIWPSHYDRAGNLRSRRAKVGRKDANSVGVSCNVEVVRAA